MNSGNKLIGSSFRFYHFRSAFSYGDLDEEKSWELINSAVVDCLLSVRHSVKLCGNANISSGFWRSR